MGGTNHKKRKAENEKQLNTLWDGIAVIMGVYLIIRVGYFYSTFDFWNWIGLAVFSVSYYVGYNAIKALCVCTYNSEGELTDGGADLNLGGMTEMYFDLIYATGIIQILTIFSDKFWILWLLIPGYAIYSLYSIANSNPLLKGMMNSGNQGQGISNTQKKKEKKKEKGNIQFKKVK